MKVLLFIIALIREASAFITSFGSSHHHHLHSYDWHHHMSSSSLADEYAINICSRSNELRWDLIPINHFDTEPNDVGVGTLALKALDHATRQDNTEDGVVHSLRCEWTEESSSSSNVWSIHVDEITTHKDEADDEFPRELECVLSRIMVQCAIKQIANENVDNNNSKALLLHVTLPLLDGSGCQKLSLTNENCDNDHLLTTVRHLFNPLNSEYAQSMELVDMVSNNGEVLGSLPRPYIHTFNILHRGIGMIVTKDRSIFDESGKLSSSPPEVYVHQRTSTKRVFPSLYDMFVGGVSSSGETATWTAAREVGEELGLKRALAVLEGQQEGEEDDSFNPLSDELFQCTICTSYNRCVVSMFAYTCNTKLEAIKWQEEEVAWGGWVSYDIVEAAGALSIKRLKEEGVWPGTCAAESDEIKGKDCIEEKQELWESWDFVPDGLLVWVAWLQWIDGEAKR
jgi:8-oxo-dGTP pyrophosphatase MutT (NUDIX family)